MCVERQRTAPEQTPLFSNKELFEKAQNLGHVPPPSEIPSIANSLLEDLTFESIEPSLLVILFNQYPQIFEGKTDADMRELLRYSNTRYFADLRLRYVFARNSPEIATSILPDLLYDQLQDSHLLDQMIDASTKGFTYQPFTL